MFILTKIRVAFLIIVIFSVLAIQTVVAIEPNTSDDALIAQNVITQYPVNKIFDAQNYVVYYGRVNETDINTLAAYDLAILEPKGVTSSELSKIRELNEESLVFGYVSVMEVEKYLDYKIQNLIETDYLHDENGRINLESYDNYLGNIASSHYQDVIIELIRNQIADRGYDGVFLDTVDNVDIYNDQFNNILVQGYEEFLEKLRINFPQLMIIQNRGFKVFQSSSYEYIDGLMFEDLEYEKITSNSNYKKVVNNIQILAKEKGIRVMSVFNNNIAELSEFCTSINWLYYYSENLSYSNSEISPPTTEVKAVFDDISVIDNESKIKIEDIKVYSEFKLFIVSHEDIVEYKLESAILKKKNGKPYKVYDHFVLDISNASYIAYLTEKLEEKVQNGASGFILTYVDLMETPKNYSISTDTQLQGYISFIKQLKNKYPDIKLIQNRNVDYLKEEVAKLIDGIYWDNFELDYNPTDQWYKNIIALLYQNQSKFDWNVYVQINSSSEEIQRLCIENEFKIVDLKL